MLTLPLPPHRRQATSRCLAAALLSPSHHRAAAKLPPTSQCRAATTAAATALLTPRFHRCAVCRRRASRCLHRSAAAKLQPCLLLEH